MADRLGSKLIPLRKAGKLPHDTHQIAYDLEYGDAVLEMHKDAVDVGDRVLIVDDLLATGGTAEAATKLIRKAGGVVIEAAFVIDLPELGGAKLLEYLGVPVRALVTFEGE
jgi:adenine phosphoribosyltransferase